MARSRINDEDVRSALHNLISASLDELSRADGKASILMGLVGAAVTVLTSALTSRHPGVVPSVLFWAADATLVVAIVLLMWTVRPILQPGSAWSWIRCVDLEPADILRESRANANTMALATRAGELARIAYSKYVRIRRAVDLLYLAGVLIMLALAATAIGY